MEEAENRIRRQLSRVPCSVIRTMRSDPCKEPFVCPFTVLVRG